MRPEKLKALADKFQTAVAYALDGAERTAIEVALEGIFGTSKQDDLAAAKWAIGAVVAARHRQIAMLGYDAQHDDEHINDELPIAAALYLLPSGFLMLDLLNRAVMEDPPIFEDMLKDNTFEVHPKSSEFSFPEHGASSVHERLDDLADAGALILAEMQRLIRRYLEGSAPAAADQEAGS